MKKRITQRAVAGLLVVLALAFTAGATSAFVGAKPFYLDAPLRFDYVPSGAGAKPILATDLDGNYVKAVTHSNQAITVTLQDGQNVQHTLSIPVGATLTGATLTGATYVADTETLTLTLSEGDPITADLSGLTTSSEVATAISAAIAAETDAVLTGATYAADSETLTLTLSEGDPITADLSGLTTSSEVATAISAAIAAETDAVLTGASYAADSETLTLTLSEGSPVTGDLSGLTTAAELSGAINAALDGVSGVTLTGASYAADSETLTLTLSEGDPITADLSGLTTSSEVATAISAAIAAETDAVLTGASYAADSETLTLTLSEGDAVTANLSGLTTTDEVAAAITDALADVTGTTVTSASFAADTKTLTLTLSEGGPVTASLTGLSTTEEVTAAITNALAAQTDATITSASYAADSELLTLTLSEGEPVTADLSGIATTEEMSTAIAAAILTVSNANGALPTLLGSTDASGADCQEFSTTDIVIPQSGWIVLVAEFRSNSGQYIHQYSMPVSLLHGLPMKISDTATSASVIHSTYTANALTLHVAASFDRYFVGLTTANRLVAGTANRHYPCRLTVYTGPAVVAQSTATVSGASFAATTQTLTLTLSAGDPVTADLSGLTTTEEVSTAISTALTGVTGTTVTAASYTEDTETLTLTLSEGTAVTADLSGLSTDAELSAAIANANATANPRLLGTHEASGATCQVFAPTDIVIPQSGWIAMTLELRNNNGQYIHEYSIPVSLLHNLPVKIDDTATSANVDNNTSTANALSLPVRALSDGYHVGLTTENRLVARASHHFAPCRISVYTGATTASSGVSATAGVTSITALTSANIPDDATEAAGLSVTHGSTTTSIKLPSLTHNPSTVYTRVRADRPNCVQSAPTGPPIPDEPFFFVILTTTNTSGRVSSVSHFILRSEIMAIPVALTGPPENLVTSDFSGDDRNVLPRGAYPSLYLARTTSNQLAWRTGSDEASCTFQIVTLTD